MALTRDFKETIQARVECDPAFREALLMEGVECILAGEVEAGKAVLYGCGIIFEGLKFPTLPTSN
jgi:hypothetical protein